MDRDRNQEDIMAKSGGTLTGAIPIDIGIEVLVTTALDALRSHD